MLICFGYFLDYLQPCLIGVESANISHTSIRNAYVSDTCIDSVGTIKYLKIYLQLSQILKVKSFGIS